MDKTFSFPRGLRLSGRKTVGRIFKEGRYHGLGLLQAKTLPRADGGPSRFMISVRKSVGGAPARNRIKRVVREAIRLNRAQWASSYDVCLFLTKPPRSPVRLSTIEPELFRLFTRLSGEGNEAMLPKETTRDDG